MVTGLVIMLLLPPRALAPTTCFADDATNTFELLH